MGCNIINYLYSYEIKDAKYSIIITSNNLTNELNKNNNASTINLKQNDNFGSENINNPIVDNLIKNNPFSFVKIKLKKNRSYK